MADMSNVIAFPSAEHAITWADQARAYRAVLSAEIERLINLLDEADGDPDAEDDDPDTGIEDRPEGDEAEHGRTPVYGVNQCGRQMHEREAADTFEAAPIG